MSKIALTCFSTALCETCRCAAIEAFAGSQDALRQVVEDRGADYLVLCTAALEDGGPDKPPPFATDLARGGQPAPDWLEPVGDVAAGSALKVWRVRRP